MITGTLLRLFYPDLEELQPSIVLDFDIICPRIFRLLGVPETWKKLVGLQEEQAQEMMDLLQKVRLAFLIPYRVHLYANMIICASC